MSKQKKPRDKKYVPKPVVKPLGIRDNISYEMDALQGLEALGSGHFVEQHIYHILSAADLVKRISLPDSEIRPFAQEIIYTICEIQARITREGVVGTTGPEMTLLRAHTGKMIAYLRDCSNVQIYRASVAALNEFNKTGVLRV